jgi:hypothetical protein
MAFQQFPASMSSSSRNLRAATSLRAARSIKSWLSGGWMI